MWGIKKQSKVADKGKKEPKKKDGKPRRKGKDIDTLVVGWFGNIHSERYKLYSVVISKRKNF